LRWLHFYCLALLTLLACGCTGIIQLDSDAQDAGHGIDALDGGNDGADPAGDSGSDPGSDTGSDPGSDGWDAGHDDGQTCSGRGSLITWSDGPVCACEAGYTPSTIDGLDCVPTGQICVGGTIDYDYDNDGQNDSWFEPREDCSTPIFPGDKTAPTAAIRPARLTCT